MGRASVRQNKNKFQLIREELGLSREKAAELLLSENISIEAIAGMVGYNTPHYFIKKFKEKEKISTTKKHKTPFKKDSFSASTESSSTDSTATNSSHNSALFEALRQLRLQIAKEESVPPYIVFTDRTLIDMCSKLPQNEDEMLNVSGVGQNKLKKYGQRFLQEISAFQSANH